MSSFASRMMILEIVESPRRKDFTNATEERPAPIMTITFFPFTGGGADIFGSLFVVRVYYSRVDVM